jgi:SAM-dependent methyltransferase
VSAYYDDNAKMYFDETLGFDMSHLLERFVKHLPQRAHILDLGCGSGRDSKWFIEHGYQVTALDGSKKMAQLASQLINQQVIEQDFRTIDWHNQFDGIWASASLLHCPRQDIHDLLSRIAIALKPNGVGFFSFKEGEGEAIDEKGRAFIYYTETTLLDELNSVNALTIIDYWQEIKMLRGKPQSWVNALVRKQRVNI